jgi:flagellar biosynthesis/type III secretory pathway chaperone
MAQAEGKGSALQGELATMIGILEEQRDLQASLVSLSEKKIKAITAGDADTLQGIVEEEKGLLGRIKLIEKKQAQSVVRIAQQLSVPVSDVCMTLIIDVAAGAQKETLAHLRGELSGLVEKQLKCNDTNMKLLQMNLDYVQFLINATSRQQVGPTYGSEGSIVGTAAGKRKLLDRKV